jgi:hypothetical protein
LFDECRKSAEKLNARKSSAAEKINPPSLETVRAYATRSENVGWKFAEQIDAAYTRIKPARSRRQRARNAATGRRVGAAKAGAANTSASRHSNSTSAAEE